MSKVVLIRKAKKYFHVELDEGDKLVLKEDTIVKFGLYKGMELSEEDIALIANEDNKLRTLEKAVNYLGYGMKTKKQVVDKLKQKGSSEENISYAVDKLSDYNYIDDEEYARVYAAKYSYKYGPKVIEMNLRHKGISPKTAKDAAYSIPDEKVAETAKQYAQKLNTKYAKLEPRERKRKIYEALIRKGFDWSSVSSLVNSIHDEENYLT